MLGKLYGLNFVGDFLSRAHIHEESCGAQTSHHTEEETVYTVVVYLQLYLLGKNIIINEANPYILWMIC